MRKNTDTSLVIFDIVNIYHDVLVAKFDYPLVLHKRTGGRK